jgi:outer membrane immunogenic protein
MKNFAMLALPFAAAVSSPALAQETTAGGFRLEALFGIDSLKAEYEEGEGRKSEGGIFGGAAIGYDFPMGTALSVGADAEFTIGSTDTNIDEGRLKAKRDFYVGGRVTGQVSETIALYGKLGYTNQRIQFETEDEDEELTLAGNLDGIRAGAGIRFSSDNNAYYGLEYRYSNYEADVDRHQGVLFIGYKF